MIKLIVECEQEITSDDWCGPWDNKILNEFILSPHTHLVTDFQEVNYMARRVNGKFQFGQHVGSSVDPEGNWDNQEHRLWEADSIEEIVELVNTHKQIYIIETPEQLTEKLNKIFEG